MRIIDRGIFSKIKTNAPIREKEGKLFIKPKGYPEMQIEKSVNYNNLFDKKEWYKTI